MNVRNNSRLSRSDQLLYLCSYFNDINCIFKQILAITYQNLNLKRLMNLLLNHILIYYTYYTIRYHCSILFYGEMHDYTQVTWIINF